MVDVMNCFRVLLLLCLLLSILTRVGEGSDAGPLPPEAIFQKLQSGDFAERQLALEELRTTSDAFADWATEDHLLQLASSEFPSARIAIIPLLARSPQIKQEFSLQLFKKLLADSDEQVCITALQVLRTNHRMNAILSPDILAAALREHAHFPVYRQISRGVSYETSRYIESMGTLKESDELPADLVVCLRGLARFGRSDLARLHAAAVVLEHGTDAEREVRIVEDALLSTEPKIRRYALEIARTAPLPEKKLGQSLLASLSSPEAEIREYACDVIATKKLEIPGAIAILRQLQRRDPDESVQRMAEEALNVLGQQIDDEPLNE